MDHSTLCDERDGLDCTLREEVKSAVCVLTSNYEAAMAAIESMSDQRRAFQLAADLGQALRTASEGATKLRNFLALRMHKDESLSRAQLADRMNLSKTRVDQIIRAAKADMEKK